MKSVGIVVSSPLEAKSFVSPLKSQIPVQISKGVWVISSGPGEKILKKAVSKLILKGVEGLMSFGFAGGLNPLLATGTIVIPKTIIHPYGPTIDTTKSWRTSLLKQTPQRYDVSEASIVNANQILYTPAQKEFYFQRTSGACVDQESFTIALMAQEAKLPFIAVRVILDDAQSALPENVAELQNDAGDIDFNLLFKALLKPTQWPQYYQLTRKYHHTQSVLESLATSQLKSSRFH